MMMNLFSVFDPTSYFNFSLNWLILIMIMVFIPGGYYLINSHCGKIFSLMYFMVGGLFKEIGMSNYLLMSFVCLSTFLFLMISNLLSLFPFIFTSTAHPMVTLGWGLVMWLSFFTMGVLKNFKMSAAHLVPEGSPFMLSPLMVMIESISHLIRPFTLSIRLAANMMAGHLIVGLLASISMINVYSFMCSILLQNILLILEFAVAIIQGFVFGILLLLYALEYY